MARKLKDWLSTYETYTGAMEAPALFHTWVGIGVISSILGRNVYLDHGAYHLLPNHYILLLANSAECRKSTALGTGYDLMKNVPDLNVRSGSITTAMMYRIMADQAQKANGVGELVLFVDELSVLFGKDEAHASLINVLTETFLGTKPLRKETKTQGVDIIPYPCINLMAATTPADLQDLFPERTSGMGFTPRCIIVFADTPRQKNPWPGLDPLIRQDLIADLLTMRTLKGTFSVTPNAKSWYTQWYLDYKPTDAESTIGAFNARRQDYVLKLAMILCVSESDTLVIEKMHVMKAVEMLEKIEPGIRAAFMEVGRVKETKNFDRVIRQMRKAGGTMSRTQLLHANWNRMDLRILMAVMDNLVAAGFCHPPLIVMKKNRTQSYSWTLTDRGRNTALKFNVDDSESDGWEGLAEDQPAEEYTT